MCRTGVGRNRIKCYECKHLVHKKCSGLMRLKEDQNYRCPRCQRTARPIDGRPQKEVPVGSDIQEVVASFCYLVDMLSEAGGCELSTITRVKTAWKKFKELLSVLSSRNLSYKTCVMCPKCDASCKRDFALDNASSTAFTAQRQSHDQTDLQCKARGCGYCRIKDLRSMTSTLS